MLPEPRRQTGEVAPAVHGGLDFLEIQALGLQPEDTLDFSANVNPYGPSPAVRAALAKAPVDRYPDREALVLRAALADFLGVPVRQIVVGNGASELIWLTALAFVRPGDPILVVGPTYSEYARAARLMAGRVQGWQAHAEDGFAPDADAIARDIQRLRPRVVFVCNPNNPTGATLPAEAVGNWARQHADTLFVVDEAYLPFAPDLRSALELAAVNVLVLRSMTKDFALAGLRLGYSVGPAALADTLRRAQPPWSVNTLAQAAGVAALGDVAHRDCSLVLLGRARESLLAGLSELGLRSVPSAVPFFLVRVGDGTAFRSALLSRGMLVRACASFGLPGHVRIATRRPEENERLLAAIREVWHPCPRGCS